MAIEVPDESERDKMLSASLIDFHEPCEAHAIKGDYEMLNILHELADEHKSFSISPSTSTMAGEIIGSHHSKASRTTVTTPLLDRTSSIDSIEDLPFDEDSILGTQNFKVLPSSNSRVTPSGYSSDTDEDEERETLEMTQVFLFEDLKDSPDMPTGESNYNTILFFNSI